MPWLACLVASASILLAACNEISLPSGEPAASLAPSELATLEASPPEPALQEFRDGIVVVRYSPELWTEGIFEASGQPAMPEITLPGLLHRSLEGCAVTVRRGGWEGEPGWRREVQDTVIGLVPYHVFTFSPPDGAPAYGAYIPYNKDAGETVLPAGVDFWVILGRDSDACLRDASEVLATFEKDEGFSG